MKIKGRKKSRLILPVNSMSDIAFLLLIFIMLISLINYRKEIKIEYPEAETCEVTHEEKNLEIWIDRAGMIFIDGTRIDLKTAEGIIAGAVAANPSVRLHLIADKNTRYRNIDGIMEILKLLQHRVVSLVIKDSTHE